MAGEEHNLFEHAQDTTVWEFLFGTRAQLPVLLPLPEWVQSLGFPGPHFRLTKYMVMEVIAAALLVAIFVPLARRAQGQIVPRGRFWNFFEAILQFIRDEIARPAIGAHDGDRFVPYLWTAFMFILFCNLLGMVPFGASATGSVSVTAPLALCTLAAVLAAGMQRLGAAGFWKALVPHMDVPVALGLFLKPLMFVLEVLGLAIRHFALAMRLFANMFAGHMVLAVLLGFIVTLAEAGSALTYMVAPMSVLGVVALSLLELFIAFLQAYIFTFLSAMFIGIAVHPH